MNTVIIQLLLLFIFIWVPIGLLIWHNNRQPDRIVTISERMQNRQNLMNMIIHEIAIDKLWAEDEADSVKDTLELLMYEIIMLIIGAIVSAILSWIFWREWIVFGFGTAIIWFIFNNIMFQWCYNDEVKESRQNYVIDSGFRLVDLPGKKRTELRERGLSYLLEPFTVAG
ncbi:MAG: hypothetical protein ABIJ92_02430 [Candidatus Aenigmatarchaeota archaeon]